LILEFREKKKKWEAERKERERKINLWVWVTLVLRHRFSAQIQCKTLLSSPLSDEKIAIKKFSSKKSEAGSLNVSSCEATIIFDWNNIEPVKLLVI
jgi:hypothetical protein